MFVSDKIFCGGFMRFFCQFRVEKCRIAYMIINMINIHTFERDHLVILNIGVTYLEWVSRNGCLREECICLTLCSVKITSPC